MTREQFEAIIKEVNDAKCLSIFYVEDDCDLFTSAHPECVADDLDKDEHRWYEITTSVYKIGEWFIGLRGNSKMYSESSDWSDCGVKTIAFEMEPITVTSYKKK